MSLLSFKEESNFFPTTIEDIQMKKIQRGIIEVKDNKHRINGENIMITSEEIKSRLWDGANELRGSMDASQYKEGIMSILWSGF